jgi:hypothetical protein
MENYVLVTVFEVHGRFNSIAESIYQDEKFLSTVPP